MLLLKRIQPKTVPGVCDSVYTDLIPRIGNPIGNCHTVWFCTLQCSLEPCNALLLDGLLEGLVNTLVKHLTTSSVTCRDELYFNTSLLCCNEIFMRWTENWSWSKDPCQTFRCTANTSLTHT